MRKQQHLFSITNTRANCIINKIVFDPTTINCTDSFLVILRDTLSNPRASGILEVSSNTKSFVLGIEDNLAEG